VCLLPLNGVDLPPSDDYGWQRVGFELAHADIPTVMASGLPQWIALFLTAAAFVMIVATVLLLRGRPSSSTIGLDALVEQLRQRAGDHAPWAARPRAEGAPDEAPQAAQDAIPAAHEPADAPAERSPRRTVAPHGVPADAPVERDPAPVHEAAPADDPGAAVEVARVADARPAVALARLADARPADEIAPVDDVGPAVDAAPVHEPSPAHKPEPSATPALQPVAPPPDAVAPPPDAAPVEQRPEPPDVQRPERAPAEPPAKPPARPRSTAPRKGARPKPPPAPAQNGPICQVRWLGKGRGSCFSAVMVDAEGVEHSVATSRRVEWRGTAPPDESPESQAALRQLSKVLRESGWRPMRGKGRDFNEERWYARRFRQVDPDTAADEVAS
jgi:hypothetical protein